jgi:hypothetical protein
MPRRRARVYLIIVTSSTPFLRPMTQHTCRRPRHVSTLRCVGEEWTNRSYAVQRGNEALLCCRSVGCMVQLRMRSRPSVDRRLRRAGACASTYSQPYDMIVRPKATGCLGAKEPNARQRPPLHSLSRADVTAAGGTPAMLPAV